MILRNTIDSSYRVGLLRNIISEKGCVTLIDAHSRLSALIANNATVKLSDGQIRTFDGFWHSSLADSASKVLPDIELVGFDSRLESIHQIMEITTRPMAVDGDTGGDFIQFAYLVNRLEKAGASMVVIEDKKFPKMNSLLENAEHQLEDVERFAQKIQRGIAARQNKNFMIVARMEGFIAGHPLDETVSRATTFLEAGADGIVIHSKSNSPAEVLEFAKAYYQLPKNLIQDRHLICIPTTYNTIKTEELKQAGFHVVIYANHLLRATYKAMEDVSRTILFNDRTYEADAICAPVKSLFDLVNIVDVAQGDGEIKGNGQQSPTPIPPTNL